MPGQERERGGGEVVLYGDKEVVQLLLSPVDAYRPILLLIAAALAPLWDVMAAWWNGRSFFSIFTAPLSVLSLCVLFWIGCEFTGARFMCEALVRAVLALLSGEGWHLDWAWTDMTPEAEIQRVAEEVEPSGESTGREELIGPHNRIPVAPGNPWVAAHWGQGTLVPVRRNLRFY